MNVSEAQKLLDMNAITLPAPDRCITGGYTGDLLSWVMGRIKADSAWITIMSNVNIVAVACLTDPACIILSENVSPDDGVVERALQQGVNILCSPNTTFEVCTDVAAVL